MRRMVFMNNKKTTVVTISTTLALILLVATATFAYFQADLGNNKEVDVTVSMFLKQIYYHLQ